MNFRSFIPLAGEVPHDIMQLYCVGAWLDHIEVLQGEDDSFLGATPSEKEILLAFFSVRNSRGKHLFDFVFWKYRIYSFKQDLFLL